MKIELLINDVLVDIDKNTAFPISFQAVDLSNPTAIKNSWSKTVTLPSTKVNDNLFNHIWKIDHQILNFNPSKRVPFVLVGDGAIIEQGYIELNSISYSGRYAISYNVTLYGGLFDFFYSISEKDMNELNLDYTHTINRHTILNTWDNTLPPWSYALTYSGLYDNFDSSKVYNNLTSQSIQGVPRDTVEVNGTFYTLIDNGGQIIKYTPGDETGSIINTGIGGSTISLTRLFYDSYRNRFLAWTGTGATIFYTNGLDLEKWERRDGFAAPVIDVITTSNYSYANYFLLLANGNIYSSDDIIESTSSGTYIGLLSNNSRMAALVTSSTNIRVLVNDIVSGDDYLLRYYRNLGGSISANTAFTTTEPQYTVNTAVSGSNNVVQITTAFRLYSSVNLGEFKSIDFPPVLNGIQKTVFVDFAFNNRFRFAAISSTGGYTAMLETQLNGGNGVSAYFNSDIDQFRGIAYSNENGKILASGTKAGNITLTYGDPFDSSKWESITGFYESIDSEENNYNEYQRNEYRSYYQRPMLRVRNLFEQILIDSGYTYTLDAGFFNTNNHYWNETYIIMERLTIQEDQVEDNKVGNIRSNDQVTFDMMIGSGITQMEFFLSYCKMFGIIVIQNKNDKSLRIIQRNDYFDEAKFENWNERIDYSRSTSIKPLTFNFKTGIIRYNDAGSKYEERYDESFGREYGSLRFDTGYEFSNNDNVFLETVFQNTVYSREYSPEFEGRYIADDYADDKILPALFKLSGNEMSYNESSYHLVFWNGMQTVKPIRISDDNSRMLDISLFMWTDAGGDYTISTQIPNITALWQQADTVVNSLYFARPAKLYYTGGYNYPNGIDIYDLYHKAYYEEIYNNNNKVLTGYFYLSNIVINQFTFNTFVTIDNTIWFVNKISDFDIANESSTKVELIRVFDLAGYGATPQESELVSPILNVDVLNYSFKTPLHKYGQTVIIDITHNKDVNIEHLINLK